ncbi:hypothetical protein C0995_008782 [Termitomyces sp. Mi166|nr:hypothetical protein C0995_008782 [Termitomyces sp. Mi166\
MTLPRPLVPTPTQYGRDGFFWVEYPSGLVDLSRSHPLSDAAEVCPPPLQAEQAEFAVENQCTIRIDTRSTAMVIIDMQNFFLHPELRKHPSGLECVDRLLESVPFVRTLGIKILWVNWGLTEHELRTIPPALVRAFQKNSGGGLGTALPHGFGRLLMRDERNSELYGPLQDEYLKGKKAGTDFWIHKNRMSGLWGYQSALDLFLKENGITTLLFGGVNADQCVLGTIVDAYYRGYDCIVVRDTTATTSPQGGLSNLLHNATNVYGFVTDTKALLAAKVV